MKNSHGLYGGKQIHFRKTLLKAALFNYAYNDQLENNAIGNITKVSKIS